MCVVSMVHDHFEPMFPWTTTPIQPSGTVAPIDPSAWLAGALSAAQVSEIRALVDRFEKAVEAAKVVDALTAQPECVDPEKAKLEKRVAYWKARAEAAEKLLLDTP